MAVVRDVPVEAYQAETLQSEPQREPTTAERREAALVYRYIEWLAAEGSTAIRKDIGQVLDYARYVDHKTRVVLLPSDPGEDLVDLLRRNGIVYVYEGERGNFVRREPG